MATRRVVKRPQVEKDVDYTTAGLLAIVAAVLITALFFAQPNVAERASLAPDSTLGGKAYGADLTPEVKCEPSSVCDGSRLLRQSARS